MALTGFSVLGELGKRQFATGSKMAGEENCSNTSGASVTLKKISRKYPNCFQLPWLV